MKSSNSVASFLSTSFFTVALAQTFTNASTMALTTISTSIITSTMTGNITLPGVSTSTSNGMATVVNAAPTGPITPIPTTLEVHDEYKLRVDTISGAKRYQGQYLAAWSVTPGYVTDMVMTKNKTLGAKFYSNGTLEQMDIGTIGKLWSMDINFDSIDARWYRVTANSPTSNGFGTFWVNQTGLQWTPNETAPPHTSGVASEFDQYFQGWVVCDWWHGAPQLFYKVGLIYNDTVLPNYCAEVNLLPEYFKN